MKKAVLFLIIALLLALSVSVAGAAPSSYDSGFQVQNLSNTSATINITFYDSNTSSVANSVTDTVAANDSNTYFPLSGSPTDIAAGFDGSVVVSSDQPIAAIANVLGDGFAFGASYGGFASGSQSVSLPLVAKNQVGLFNTFFNVQNAGNSTANVTVNYAGTSCSETANIEPGFAARFDQSTNTCLPDGHVGAATVTAGSGQSIVATVIETSEDEANGNNAGLFAYNGFTGGSTDLVIPLVQFNNAGFHSGVQIQNTGSASTNVTLSYTPVSDGSGGTIGTACTETRTIAAGASATFGLGIFTFNESGNFHNCTGGQRFVGSAAVSANSGSQPLVAIINQTNFTNFGSAYNGFDPSTATTSLSMPLIMDRNAGFQTGFNLQNVGTTSTAVTCTFTNSSHTETQTLAAGEAMNRLQGGVLGDPYVGSATCDSDGEPIIAVVNELGTTTSDDQLFTYEGFNK